MKFSPNSSATHVPLLQSIKSQISTGGLGVGEIVRIKDDEAIGTSQNKPVKPGKHSQITKSPSNSMHTPLVQLKKSHIEILTDGVGETMIELVEGVAMTDKLEEAAMVSKLEGAPVISRLEEAAVVVKLEGTGVACKLDVIETALEGIGGTEEGRRIKSELEIEKVKSEEVKNGVVDVRNGTRRLSELGMMKINDEVKDMEDVGVIIDETERGISQNSPVNPVSH